MTQEFSKEQYKESLQADIEAGDLMEQFITTDYWNYIKSELSNSFPKENPYDMKDILAIKEQGGFIRGLEQIELIITGAIEKGRDAKQEIKNQEAI